MKHKLNFFAKFFAVTMTLTSLIFVSCDKEQNEAVIRQNKQNISTAEKGNHNLPYFTDKDALESAVSIATSCDTITDLKAFETLQGRQSIGALSDAFYETIDYNKIQSEEDALNFYRQHLDMLDTMIVEGNDIAIVPKFFHSPYRYVANTDGMFAVSNYVYKIFKSCVVAAPDLYVDNLSELKECDLATADTSIFHFVIVTKSENTDIHSECVQKWTVSNNPTSPNDRIHIILQTQIMYYQNTGRVAISRVQVYNLHQWCWVWWTSRHNLTCNADVTFHSNTTDCTSWDVINRTASRTQSCNTLWIALYERPCNWNSLNWWDIIFHLYSAYYHYIDYSITAFYPGHSQETLSFH